MPEEVFIIVVVAILAGTFSGVIKTIVGYLRERDRKTGGDNSLTTSELKQIVADTVAEATAPLEDRFAMLERRMERQLPPAETPSREPDFVEDSERIGEKLPD